MSNEEEYKKLAISLLKFFQKKIDKDSDMAREIASLFEANIENFGKNIPKDVKFKDPLYLYNINSSALCEYLDDLSLSDLKKLVIEFQICKKYIEIKNLKRRQIEDVILEYCTSVMEKGKTMKQD